MNLTLKIIRFEQGEMEHDEFLELFQHLIDTGIVWDLQGQYGRTAQILIENHLCHYPNAFGEVIQ